MRDPYAFYVVALDILRSSNPQDLSQTQRLHQAIDQCIESVRGGGLEQFFQNTSAADVHATADALLWLGKRPTSEVLLRAYDKWVEAVSVLPSINVRFGEHLPDLRDSLMKSLSTYEADYVEYELKD